MMTSEIFVPPAQLNTAVLLLIFNRIDTVEKVFGAIRKAKPPRLYISADGPRGDIAGELEKTEAVRKYVVESVDWECQVLTLFNNENVGCKRSVTNGISWFFKNEEQGIILEDDCLPSQSFFWYCEFLLDKYKNCEDVYLISGDGRNTKELNLTFDYSFTKYAHIWGWATWRRTWSDFDLELTGQDRNINILIPQIIKRKESVAYIRYIYKALCNGRLNAVWDYQFVIYCLISKGLCIVPSKNLISNIGHGSDATHTFDSKSTNANVPRHEFIFPISSPPTIDNCVQISDLQEKREYNMPSYWKRIFARVLRICEI